VTRPDFGPHFNWDLLIPWGYQRSEKTLAGAWDILEPNYHPEAARRFIFWLHEQGGKTGIGGHFRPLGTQPGLPGFAPEGKSFHQPQDYRDGVQQKACALDLVVRTRDSAHRAPRWEEVPVQGSGEAVLFGVHANVSTESWHVQPIEIDGFFSWRWLPPIRQAPAADYPLPEIEPTNSKEITVNVSLTKIRMGDSGPDVSRAQAILWHLFDQAEVLGAVDGHFGPATDRAVRNFQTVISSLEVDGIVGPKTWTALIELPEE